MEFGTAVGGFIGSPLLASLGGRGLYFAFGTVVLAIVAITALIQKRLPSEQELLASAVRQERHRATWVIRAGLPFFRRTRFCNQHREVSANTPGPEDYLVAPTYSSVRTLIRNPPGGTQERRPHMREAGRTDTASRSHLCAVAPMSSFFPKSRGRDLDIRPLTRLSFRWVSSQGSIRYPDGKGLRARIHKMGLDPLCGA